MIIAASLLSGILVIAIAWASLDWLLKKTSKMPDQILIEPEEALEFCAQALPDEMTAVLSYPELRSALKLHLEWIQAFHWTPEGASDKPIAFDTHEPVEYMLERADIIGLEITEQQVKSIIEAHSAYLEAIGALYVGDVQTAQQDLKNLPLLEKKTDLLTPPE